MRGKTALRNKLQRHTLTPRQFAEEYGFGISWTYKMLADGTLPSIRTGKRFVIPRVSVENWLASCGKEQA